MLSHNYPPIDLNQVRQALGRASEMDREIQGFKQTWPDPPTVQTPFPSFSWEQLERQVLSLAATPSSAETAQAALQGWRTLSWTTPPEMVLREVLIVVWAALDESFQPGPLVEPEFEDGEAPMP